MSNMRLEQLRILFLNKKNILIADEVLSQGTIDQAAVYPREIIKRALFNEKQAALYLCIIIQAVALNLQKPTFI